MIFRVCYDIPDLMKLQYIPQYAIKHLLNLEFCTSDVLYLVDVLFFQHENHRTVD